MMCPIYILLHGCILNLKFHQREKSLFRISQYLSFILSNQNFIGYLFKNVLSKRLNQILNPDLELK